MGNQKLTKNRRDERRAAERDELLGKAPENKTDGRKGIEDEWQTLNAQIGALESFLHGIERKAAQQRKNKLENIIPPPDRGDLPRDRAGQRMSRWQERHYHEARQRHGLVFLMLFGAVCAVLWWLLNGSGSM
ncbi:MAG: hypothetical protein JNK37_04660 [Verrucomicrobiales bacterium]|nr:hypothetical protein [Verrucomicrobiales bacterium]